MSESCAACGGPIPDDYGKWDPKAPVYADEFVVHLECEQDVFETIYAEVQPAEGADG